MQMWAVRVAAYAQPTNRPTRRLTDLFFFFASQKLLVQSWVQLIMMMVMMTVDGAHVAQ